jgi:hypothetical protein
MKKKLLVAGALALSVAVTGSQLIAAPGDKKGKQGGKGAGPAAMQIRRIEQVLGTTLTDEQKTAVVDATKTYNEAIAKAVGLTLDDWNAKQKEFREKQAAANKDKAK